LSLSSPIKYHEKWQWLQSPWKRNMVVWPALSRCLV
jgi:hypothetical protein